MHIAFLTAGDQPGRCGVTDYTWLLARHLRRQGAKVSLLDAGAASIAALERQLRASGADVLSVQYPMDGFAASLTPHLLAVFASCPSMVTLHEYTHAHPLRRWSLRALRLSGRTTFVFTTDTLKRAFHNWPAACLDAVIPIGSNIPFHPPVPKEPGSVVHFGLIRPARGLEGFLALAHLAALRNRPYRFQLLGAVPGAQHAFAQRQLGIARDLGVDILLNLPPEQVAACLARAEFGYLPFPQGADERQGSLLALLGNRVATLTRSCPDTPSELAACVEYVDTPEQALACLDRSDPKAWLKRLSAATNYAQGRDWDVIACRYLEVFDAVVRHARSGSAGP